MNAIGDGVALEKSNDEPEGSSGKRALAIGRAIVAFAGVVIGIMLGVILAAYLGWLNFVC